MNENIKAFSLVVITICVFVIAVIDILGLINDRKHNHEAALTTEHRNQEYPPINVGTTTIKFDEMSYDFGEIREGEVVNHSFSFTNTGSAPLIISNAAGSCGCTVPTYSKRPIPPGEKGTIEVQFNSKGRKDAQDKKVTITANTDPATTDLTIHAVVLDK